MVWNEMSDVAFDQILIRSVLSTRTISIFAVPICKGVNGYLKLSGQVVMPRAATALPGGNFYSAKNWMGNCPPCPPATDAPVIYNWLTQTKRIGPT